MEQPTDNSPKPSEEPKPFMMPPNIVPPEPMGGPSLNPPPGNQPSPSQPPQGPKPPNLSPPKELPSDLAGPKKPIGPYILMLFLIFLLILGGVFFASFKGWISIFGLDKLFRGSTPAPLPTLVVESPLSPTASPTTSPIVTSNINDETRKKDLISLKNALKKYFSEKGEYPKSEAMLKTSDKTSVLYQALVPTYLESLADDPQAPQYYYGYKSDGTTFELTAVLEDKSDPAGNLQGSLNIYKVTNSSVE